MKSKKQKSNKKQKLYPGMKTTLLVRKAIDAYVIEGLGCVHEAAYEIATDLFVELYNSDREQATEVLAHLLKEFKKGLK